MDEILNKITKFLKAQKFLVLLLFMLISVLSFSSERELKKVKLQLRGNHKFQFAGYYAAKEKGYYREKGLDVEIKEIHGDENPVDVVVRGDADFGIGGSDLIIERAGGKKIVLLASVFQHSPLVFISPKSAGIDNLHDIMDKKIALGATDKELLVYLNNEGIDIKKMNISTKSSSDDRFYPDRFDVSSYNLNDGIYRFDEIGMEINIFNPRTSGIDFYGDSIFTSEKFLKKNSKEAKYFLEASIKGWDYALRNKEEIAELIYRKYSSKKNKIQLMNEAYETDKVVMPLIVSIGYTNKGRWEFIAEEFKKIGLIQEDFDIDGFIFRKNNIEIESKTFNTVVLGVASLLVWVIAVNRIIFSYNEKLKKEMKEKSILLDMVTKSEAELREFVTIIEHSPVSVIITDANGNITYANKAVFAYSGYEKEELIGKRPSVFKSGYHSDEFYKEMWEEISSGKEWYGEFRNAKKSGEIFWERTAIIPVKDENGEIYSYLALKEDITERKKQLELLQTHAEKDDLTGIYNRRFGLRILDNEIKKAEEDNYNLFICFIDLNKLKYVNDYFGHDYGDEMIKSFSKIVAGELREKDIFFRLGGDEFLIIFSKCTMEIVEKVWDRIKEALETENRKENRLYNISASHGIVRYEEKFKNMDEFISEADKKMYEEKRIMNEAR